MSASQAKGLKYIFVRVDGHHKFGLGHIFRALKIAAGLERKFGLEPVFLILQSTLDTGVGRVLNDENYQFIVVSGASPNLENFDRTREAIRKFSPVAMLTDLLTPDPSDDDLLLDDSLQFFDVAQYIERVMDFGISIVSVTDEPESILIRPHIVIDHSCHHPAIDYSQISETNFHLGPAYYPLGEDFARLARKSKTIPKRASKILIMFGGSDHNYYTIPIAKRLASIERIAVTVLLGPAVSDKRRLQAELELLGMTTVISPQSVAQFMFDADIAVTAGGNTTFEFSAMGTPAISLCVRERQNRNSAFFAEQGCLINMGIGDDVSSEEVGSVVEDLIENQERRLAMSKAGPNLVDGKGLERITTIVGEHVNANKAGII